MANLLNLALQTPGPLEIYKNAPANWKKFKQKWQNYSRAIGLNEEPDDKQVATLLTVIGDDALAEYNKFKWSKAGDENKMAVVMKKFDTFCQESKNTTYERYLFNTTVQEEGQTIEQYVTQLRTLAENCEYGDLEESLIMDRLILGMRNEKLRERLLNKSDLTLQVALEEIKTYEATRKQMRQITDTSSPVHAFRERRSSNNANNQYSQRPPSRQQQRKTRSNKEMLEECSRCGKEHERKKD